MSLLQYDIESSKARSDPGFLTRWRDGWNIREQMLDEWNIIHEQWNWLVHTKSWPYSDKDFQIIYIWDDLSISSIEWLDERDSGVLFELLEKVVSGLELEYSEEINSSKLQLIVWINTAIIPWAWKTQSVFRPHVHVTLLSNEIWTTNNIVTREYQLADKHRKDMAINQQNLWYIEEFWEYLLAQWVEFKKSFNFDDNNYYAIDIALDMSGVMMNTENLAIFQDTHHLAYSFSNKKLEWYIHELYSWIKPNVLQILKRNEKDFELKSSTEKKEILNEILKTDNSLDLSTLFQQIGFTTLLYTENDGERFLRIKFAHKNPGENSGMIESSGGIGKILWRIITRKNVDNPNLPDMTEIKRFVWGILK